jgi:hypothetical protein
LAASSAQAGILLTFDQPFQVAQPGDLLHFSGLITNTGADEVFLNADSFTPLSPDFTLNDQFFATVPASLLGGTDSGPIDMFDIQVGNAPFGIYGGSYSLQGGANADAGGELAVAEFSIEVVPEPGTAGLLGLSAAFAFGFLRLRRRNW